MKMNIEKLKEKMENRFKIGGRYLIKTYSWEFEGIIKEIEKKESGSIYIIIQDTTVNFISKPIPINLNYIVSCYQLSF